MISFHRWPSMWIRTAVTAAMKNRLQSAALNPASHRLTTNPIRIAQRVNGISPSILRIRGSARESIVSFRVVRGGLKRFVSHLISRQVLPTIWGDFLLTGKGIFINKEEVSWIATFFR